MATATGIGAALPYVASCGLNAVVPLVMSQTGTVVAGVGTMHGTLTAAVQVSAVAFAAPSLTLIGGMMGALGYLTFSNRAGN